MVATDVRKIQRVPLVHVDDVEAELRGAVLAKAHQVFGYAADTFGMRGPLAAALSGLGIAPLDAAQVRQYMQNKKKETVVSRRAKTFVAFNISFLIVLCGSFGIAAANTNWTSFWPGGMEIIAAVVITAVGLFFGNAYIDDEVRNRKVTQDWVTYHIGSTAAIVRNSSRYGEEHTSPYPRYIPVHVLNEAIQVKEACPTAVFTIDELTLAVSDVPKPMPDPFLWVTLGSESYPIAVWDEREFKERA